MEIPPPETENNDDALVELRVRAETLERQIGEMQRLSDSRLILAEIKMEALRFGMVDQDGLKLLDLSSAKLNERGEVEGAAQLMTQLKKAKPWLFGAASSSSATAAPPAQPVRQKLATEMTDAEYRAARATLLKRRS
jgi:hypothetical protein